MIPSLKLPRHSPLPALRAHPRQPPRPPPYEIIPAPVTGSDCRRPLRGPGRSDLLRRRRPRRLALILPGICRHFDLAGSTVYTGWLEVAMPTHFAHLQNLVGYLDLRAADVNPVGAAPAAPLTQLVDATALGVDRSADALFRTGMSATAGNLSSRRSASEAAAFGRWPVKRTTPATLSEESRP